MYAPTALVNYRPNFVNTRANRRIFIEIKLRGRFEFIAANKSRGIPKTIRDFSTMAPDLQTLNNTHKITDNSRRLVKIIENAISPRF